MIRSPLRVLALSSVAFVVFAGCASLLGDFSVGDAGAGGDGGDDASDGAANGDTKPVPPGPDAADTGGDTASGPDTSSATEGGDTSVAVDSGGDGTADVVVDQSAPWTPAVLDAAGELAFWLEASSGNVVISNGVVGVWNDLSKNKNNASNSNDGPTVVSSAIHGHDALGFGAAGLALYMTDATSLQFGTDQLYIAAVAQVSSGSPYFFAKYTTQLSGGMPYYATGIMFYATTHTTGEGGSVLGPVVDDNYQSGDEVGWNGTGFEDGAFHIVAMRRTNSTTFVLSVDDQPLETGTTGQFDVSVPGQNASVGAVHFGTFVPTTSFKIAEVLAVHPSSGVVADADVANVHAYLKQKYGL